MQLQKYIQTYFSQKDGFWLTVWITGILLAWIWNVLFLNAPALHLVEIGFLNTIAISTLVIIFSVSFAWLTAVTLYFSKSNKQNILSLILTFLLNLIRSIPQIVGILIGYVVLTWLIQTGIIINNLYKMIGMSLVLSFFIFLEIHDLLIERINHFKKLDYFNAMLVCGIKEFRIVNLEIIFRNSRVHLLNKLIAVFGMAIFLQCSIDFIISIGLSTEISSINFPVTLGSLLAKIDSKQDILAVGYSLTHWTYWSKLFFEHLQGITIAFLIVFTLICIYHISNWYAYRHRL